MGTKLGGARKALCFAIGTDFYRLKIGVTSETGPKKSNHHTSWIDEDGPLYSLSPHKHFIQNKEDNHHK